MKINFEIELDNTKENLEVYEYKIKIICMLFRLPYYYEDILKDIYNEKHKSIDKDLQYEEKLYYYESAKSLWSKFGKKYHEKPLSIRRYLGLLKNYNILLKHPVMDKLTGSYYEMIDNNYNYTYIINTDIINNKIKFKCNIEVN